MLKAHLIGWGCIYLFIYLFLQIKRALTWTVCGTISDANRYKTKVDISIFLISCWYIAETEASTRPVSDTPTNRA